MQKSLFSIEETNGWEYEKFKQSSWGQLHAVLPWSQLVELLPARKTRKGREPYFDNQGMIALMFLKHQTGLSDEKLIESINHNVSQQLFCNMRLGHLELIGDTGIVSRIRSYLAHHLDLDKVQEALAQNWSSELSQPTFLKMDATCMESYIRYPTDVKLLWECCTWVYEHIFEFRKLSDQPLGKAKDRYREQQLKQLPYEKLKRKSYKKRRRRIRSLLNLLSNGGWLLIDVLAQDFVQNVVGTEFYHTLGTVFQILDQQRYLFENPGEKVKDRIVSLYKSYLRPIKRGKEKKTTEFGAKVHVIQVDGLCLIEHFSWNAFYEGNRFESSIELHRKLFGECHQVSADKAYGSNKNRKFCATEGIQAGFVGKGRKPKKEIRTLKAALNKDRATRLEGSFGNQKNHYLLRKVKARNEHTEKLWVYFGVFTANAVWIQKKREQIKPKEKKRKAKRNVQLAIAA